MVAAMAVVELRRGSERGKDSGSRASGERNVDEGCPCTSRWSKGGGWIFRCWDSGAVTVSGSKTKWSVDLPLQGHKGQQKQGEHCGRSVSSWWVYQIRGCRGSSG
jgi:hypothetical protein